MKTRLFFIAISIIFFIFALNIKLSIAGVCDSTICAYVTNQVDNTVTIIDTSSNQVVGEPIKVSNLPGKIAVTPDGSKVYLTHTFNNTISVINAANNQLTNISINNPDGIAVAPDGKKVYVTHFAADSSFNFISIIDSSTNQINTITVHKNLRGIAITLDGNSIYVGNFNDFNPENDPNDKGGVSILNSLDNSLITRFPLTIESPQEIGVAPDSKRVYVTNIYPINGSPREIVSTLVVIDNLSNPPKVIDTIPLRSNGRAGGIAVAPDSKRVFVADPGGFVHIIDSINDNYITKINIGRSANGIAITPDGTKLYVTDSLSNNIAIINTATNGVTHIAAGKSPTGIGIPPFTITSPLESYIKVGKPFIYKITSAGAKTFNAIVPSPQSEWLKFDGVNTLSGIPTENDIFNVLLKANNGTVEIVRDLKLIITKYDPPLINSSLIAEAKVGAPFTYKISALSDPLDSSPITLKAFSLPNGLSFDGKDTISGTPTIDGVFNIQLSASNSETTTNKTLILNIVPIGGSGCELSNSSYPTTPKLFYLFFFLITSLGVLRFYFSKKSTEP